MRTQIYILVCCMNAVRPQAAGQMQDNETVFHTSQAGCQGSECLRENDKSLNVLQLSIVGGKRSGPSITREREGEASVEDCPWITGPHNGIAKEALCEDGAYSWQCTDGGHGQRILCPKSHPHMCEERACGGWVDRGTYKDHCCEKQEEECKMGPRKCHLACPDLSGYYAIREHENIELQQKGCTGIAVGMETANKYWNFSVAGTEVKITGQTVTGTIEKTGESVNKITWTNGFVYEKIIEEPTPEPTLEPTPVPITCECTKYDKYGNPSNGYICSDGYAAYCAHWEECYSETAWEKGQWHLGCMSKESYPDHQKIVISPDQEKLVMR